MVTLGYFANEVPGKMLEQATEITSETAKIHDEDMRTSAFRKFYYGEEIKGCLIVWVFSTQRDM
jgi:hypothetical protein